MARRLAPGWARVQDWSGIGLAILSAGVFDFSVLFFLVLALFAALGLNTCFVSCTFVNRGIHQKRRIGEGVKGGVPVCLFFISGRDFLGLAVASLSLSGRGLGRARWEETGGVCGGGAWLWTVARKGKEGRLGSEGGGR